MKPIKDGERFFAALAGHEGCKRRGCAWLLSLILVLAAFVVSAEAASDSATQARVLPEPFGRQNLQFENRWGGHLKARGSVAWPSDDSLSGAFGRQTLYDGSLEGRLKNTLEFESWFRFDTHYELVWAGGDSRRGGSRLQERFPNLASEVFATGRVPQDDRRLLDLSRVIAEDDSGVLYHRLDRLFLTLTSERAAVTVGRQAITWGNGLLFNPMDLFNPFAPTDIERDYKLGDDLILVQLPFRDRGNTELLFVPRRDPSDGSLKWSQSSLAGKIHFSSGSTEFDFMLARHFEDAVAGLGAVGYLGGAAWRIDATWTFLDPGSPSDDYLSLTANIDYAWVWWEKNFYGFLEFFYSGLGETAEQKVFSNPDLLDRLDRGELFTVGRLYLAGSIRLELHPLFNLFVTAIDNVQDMSGVIQPRAVWDVEQNVQVLFGGNILYGGRGTEYGGIFLPGAEITTRAPNSFFVWLSYYF